MLLGAPGLTTRNKKLLGAPGIATRSKDATRNKCIATSNKCLTSSNKKLVETSASLLGARMLAVCVVVVKTAPSPCSCQGRDHGWLRIITKVMDESGGGAVVV